MEISKNISSIILVLLVSLLYGYKSPSGVSENNAFPSNTDINSIGAVGQDMTTNEDFSCTISFYKNRYIKGEPVLVKVKLTNHTDNDVTVRDCAQHYPFYSFEINDPAWRPMKLKKELETSFTKLNPEFKIIKPDKSYEVEINLSDWYDFSQAGRYTIKAKWCCFMKRAPYERNSNITEIVIKPREQESWFDPNKMPIEPIWSGVPDDWTKNILRAKFMTYLKTKMESDFNNVTSSIKDDGIHLAYNTRKYDVNRPASKSGVKMITRTETGPEPDGLILDIWLTEQMGQLRRPQLLDRTYWKLYATELYLPEMKLYIEANINYGADVEKNTLTKYKDPAGWMDDITGIKASSDAVSNESSLPDYVKEVLQVFPELEVMQCDEKTSMKIDGREGYRLVLRQSWKDYTAALQQSLPQSLLALNPPGQAAQDNLENAMNLSVSIDENLGNPENTMKYSHIDLVVFKNENNLPDNIIEKIPWLKLRQEYFVKPVYIGKGHGFDWFVNTTISFQEVLRKSLNLEGGEDRLGLLTDALFSQNTYTITYATPLLSEYGDKAVTYIETAVLTNIKKDPWYAILALHTIPSQKCTELIKNYYYSDNNRIRSAAAYSLIYEPFKEQAKDEYFDMLAKQKYIREIGKVCIEFKWKDALPIFEDICNNPKSLHNYYTAFIEKRSIEGRDVPAELIKAQETLKYTAFPNEENNVNPIAEAKRIILESTDREAAVAIALNLINFSTKAPNETINQVRNFGLDILETLPKAEKTKLYNALEESLEAEQDRNLLQKFREMLNSE